MASSLTCSEMLEESPDVYPEMQERGLQDEVPPQVIVKQREIIGFTDNNLLYDQRVFTGMLQMEKMCAREVIDYFSTIQTDITPEMKTAVAVWMFEVCEEERMHHSVFLRAIQYMDKFLALQRIFRTQLQLLGAVCLLLSSKIAGTTISAQRLVSYTADSCTADLIREWEELVLGLLNWDVYGIVSFDFVQHLLRLLPLELWSKRVVSERIKTFTAYCAVDHRLGGHLPSIIASASIAAAMTPFLSPETLEYVLTTVQSVTKVDINQLKICMEQITAKVQLTVEDTFRNGDRLCIDVVEPTSDDNSASVKSSGGGCIIKAR